MSSLRWSVRESFIRYLAAQSDAWVYVGESAEIVGDEFAFPLTSPPDSSGVYVFSGVVMFSAHSGLLQVEIRDPSIRPSRDGFVLSAVHNGKRLDFAGIAEIRADDSPGWTARTTTLLAEAAALFGGAYQPGTPLADPVLVP